MVWISNWYQGKEQDCIIGLTRCGTEEGGGVVGHENIQQLNKNAFRCNYNLPQSLTKLKCTMIHFIAFELIKVSHYDVLWDF